MDISKFKEPIVSVTWLQENIENPNLVILDASIPKAGQTEDSLTDEMIEGARFIDLKTRWAKSGDVFPNTMLEPIPFQEAARQLGINNDSIIIAYDEHGIYSSARAWYMFKAMGHQNIAVLDGGLPAWSAENLPTQAKNSYEGEPGNFTSTFSASYFKNYPEVLEQLDDPGKLVLDARANDRFLGLTAEPRKSLRSGHIPNSENLPFGDLENKGKMKSKEELEALFSAVVKNDQELIFSCGSGITACVLALGAEMTGRKNISVYDGSWTEWGSLPNLPVD